VPRLRPFLVGLLVIAAFFAAMWVMSRSGYPGGPDECIRLGDCYCEAIGPGIAAQPANSWSNLGFAAIGLLVLLDAGKRRLGTARIAVEDRYAVLYGAVGVFLGLGSFAFHGSMRAWGGYLDVISMHAFLAFMLAYDLARIHDRAWGWFFGWFGGLLAVFSALVLWLPPEHGKTLFAVFVGVTLLAEAAVSYPALRPWAPRRIDPRRMPWFWAGLATFAVAFVIWNLSRTGGVWCDPESLLQGHALWHLLSGLSVGCFYLYLRGEGPEEAVSHES
jgi:hypothetical protein